MSSKKIFLILFLLFYFSALSQVKKNKYSPIYVKVNSVPDSLTYTSEKLTNYINANFSTNADKARAIYYWITAHITYDIDNMFAINFKTDKTQSVTKTLATQKGICLDYAYLFQDLATRCNIPCIVVLGFTKQSGFVDYTPHAWVIAKPDSAWFLCDPPRGSGHIENKKFVREINEFYYNTKPFDFIKNHFPYDPLWQLSNYPLTQAEFFDADFKEKKTKPYFNFNDSIAQYQNLSDLDKDVAAVRRIENNGVKNTLTFDRLVNLKREVEYIQSNRAVNVFNEATNYYNNAVNLFNDYGTYKNKQFTPEKPDAEIKKMVDTVAASLILSQNKILEIKHPELINNIDAGIKNLQKLQADLKTKLDGEVTFVNNYLATKKSKRKALFYQKTYSLFGVPIK